MTPRPKNYKLTSFLYYKGIKFEDSEPYYSEERIQNLYETDSPLYYIAWDKIDELKSKFPKLKVNKKIDFEITPLDCAIKYGSELCFNYLKNQGGEYTEKSAEYAIKGGNINIFEQMIENGQSFDGMINTALIYHHYKIAEYLHTNFGQIPNSPAKFMYYGSYDVVSYLLSNGADINDIHTFNKEYKYRESILSIAASLNSIEIVQYSVKNGADINVVFESNGCPLSRAIENKSIEIVQYLVEHRADVSIKFEKHGEH